MPNVDKFTDDELEVIHNSLPALQRTQLGRKLNETIAKANAIVVGEVVSAPVNGSVVTVPSTWTNLFTSVFTIPEIQSAILESVFSAMWVTQTTVAQLKITISGSVEVLEWGVELPNDDILHKYKASVQIPASILAIDTRLTVSVDVLFDDGARTGIVSYTFNPMLLK